MEHHSVISKRQLICVCMCAIVIVLVVILVRRPVAKLVMCDVGQGDGIYMRLENGTDVLVDTGPDAKILECLGREMPFMDRAIDMLFITHAHKDHYGGMEYVLGRYHVKRVYVVPVYTGSKTFRRDIDYAEKVSHVQYVTHPFDLELDTNQVIHILWPDERWFMRQSLSSQDDSVLKKSSGDMNAFSMVIYADVRGADILLTGDLPSQFLAQVARSVQKPIAILKVSHHGSNTGLNEKLLQELQPSLALISVGKHNRYQHPSQEVTDILRNHKVPYLLTSEQGSIRIDFMEAGWRLK